MGRLWRRALLVMTAKVRTILAIPSATAVAPTAMPAETILAAVALIVTVLVLAGILLRLAATGDERWQPAQLLSAFMAALVRLLVIGLWLLLRPVVHLLIARREWLRIARQIRLLLRFARRVARFVLAHERLGVVIVAVKSLIGVLLAGRALLLLLRLLVVIRVLLTELLLRCGNQAKIVLGMLIVVLRRNRITRAL